MSDAWGKEEVEAGNPIISLFFAPNVFFFLLPCLAGKRWMSCRDADKDTDAEADVMSRTELREEHSFCQVSVLMFSC